MRPVLQAVTAATLDPESLAFYRLWSLSVRSDRESSGPGEALTEADSDRRWERKRIRQAQQGSEVALEELFRRHWPAAHRAALLVVHDSAAAEDIAQEAFLRAVRALDRFDRRRPFGPWLHRIVVNRAIDWSRARAVRREVLVDEIPAEHRFTAAGGAASTTSDAPDRDPFARNELIQALAALNPEQRAVVVLRYVLDYTPGEIAGLLELPRGTVNSRMRRALDELARRLGGDLEGRLDGRAGGEVDGE